MRKPLAFVTLTIALSSLTGSIAQAGPMGYATGAVYTGGHCAESKFQGPRYEQVLPYRHFEDRRRYNACPCPGELIAIEPYIVRTVIVRKARVPQYYTDSRGITRCHKVLTIVYKDIYSDGSCYVYTARG